VFVDTDRVPARDTQVGGLVQNEKEAKLVCQLTEAFVGSGVREEKIGIISLYRQQIKLLSYLLQDRKDIEILTADRSQGRDKDCIIVSMVRSNDDGTVRFDLFERVRLYELIHCVDRRSCEGLEKDECIFHPRAFEACHLWI
jgi:AAA domain